MIKNEPISTSRFDLNPRLYPLGYRVCGGIGVKQVLNRFAKRCSLICKLLLLQHFKTAGSGVFSSNFTHDVLFYKNLYCCGLLFYP